MPLTELEHFLKRRGNMYLHHTQNNYYWIVYHPKFDKLTFKWVGKQRHFDLGYPNIQIRNKTN